MTKTKPYTPQKERLKWNKVFQDAEEQLKQGKKPFLPSTVADGALWPTCACGTADVRIPRLSDGEPLDCRLYILGISFLGYLQSANDSFEDGNMEESMFHVGVARKCMEAIDERGAVVIAEEIAKEDAVWIHLP